jgi:hydroxymethylpyrimidine pyrophosphatase-like HAD family hydrolase
VSAEVRLFVSDVDGTLMTPDETFTEETMRAIEKLGEVDVAVNAAASRVTRLNDDEGFAPAVDRFVLDAETPPWCFRSRR